MIPNDQPLRNLTIKRMIGRLSIDVFQFPENYSKWEQDFIESISDQFLEKKDLTNKQCEILERLYDKD